MIKKLIPIILLIVGAGAGAGAGIFLRPAPEPEMADDGMAKETALKDGEMSENETEAEEGKEEQFEYLKMSSQFVIPIVNKDQVSSLVVLSLSLEVPIGQQQVVFTREPKIRDSFLRVLFDHANVGGFDGAFTNATNLDSLRTALREVAKRDMGELVTDVLITEIARQDY